MVSRRLMGAWAFFDLALLASGAIAVAFSIVWRKPDVLLNLTISNADLTAGTVMGIFLLITFAISIGAVVQRNHVTLGFVLLNWALVVDSVIIVVIGSFVWFYTLRERANFHEIWLGTTRDNRIFIQDKFQCCGYFPRNDTTEEQLSYNSTVEVGGNFCTSLEFANQLDITNTNKFCVTPVTNFADVTLNNIFTVVYGFMAVVICLFLTSLCVIKKRQEDERFKKIDAKRGGRGFV